MVHTTKWTATSACALAALRPAPDVSVSTTNWQQPWKSATTHLCRATAAMVTRPCAGLMDRLILTIAWLSKCRS